MKKILLLLVLMATFSLSAHGVEGYINFDFSAPLKFELEQNQRVTSLAVGVAPRVMFNKIIGLYGCFDLVFPVKITKKTAVGEVTYNIKDYEHLIGFDMLIAPAIVPVERDIFKLLLAPGFHLNNTTYDGKLTKVSDTSIGIGMNTIGELHFTKSFYMDLGFGLFYDFYRFSSTTVKLTDSKTKTKGTESELVFQPRIGFGFHF